MSKHNSLKRKRTQKYTNVHTPFKHIYKIHNNTIYFSEYYDESFDDYNVIARDYPILKIGYPDESRCQGNPRVTLTKHLKWFGSGPWFKQPVILTKYLTHLTFGYYFSHPIVLTKYLIFLKVGGHFWKPISLNKRMRHLEMESDHWDFPNDLTKNIITVKFSRLFNQPIILPKYIVRITFGYFFQKPIVLTKYLRELTINKCPFVEYPLDVLVLDSRDLLDNLPNGIKRIKTTCYYKSPNHNLPNTMVNVVHCAKDSLPTFQIVTKLHVEYYSEIYK